MRNNCPCRALILLLLILLSGAWGSSLSAQLIGNSLDIHVGYGMGTFPGEDYVTEGNFKFPSLYANLQQAAGFSAGITWWTGKYYGIGLRIYHMEGKNWQHPEEIIYLGSSVGLTSAQASFLLRSHQRESGLLNRMRFTAGISPLVGQAETRLALPINLIVNESTENQSPTESRDLFFGLRGSLGASYSFTQSLAIYIEYSLGKQWTGSVLHSDQGFLQSGIEGGLILKLRKHKTFLF